MNSSDAIAIAVLPTVVEGLGHWTILKHHNFWYLETARDKDRDLIGIGVDDLIYVDAGEFPVSDVDGLLVKNTLIQNGWDFSKIRNAKDTPLEHFFDNMELGNCEGYFNELILL